VVIAILLAWGVVVFAVAVVFMGEEDVHSWFYGYGSMSMLQSFCRDGPHQPCLLLDFTLTLPCLHAHCGWLHSLKAHSGSYCSLNFVTRVNRAPIGISLLLHLQDCQRLAGHFAAIARRLGVRSVRVRQAPSEITRVFLAIKRTYPYCYPSPAMFHGTTCTHDLLPSCS
jgi:hypothetical protein